MKKTALDTLKGSYQIDFNGEYVVLSGAKLYIFKPDGTQVVCRPDLRHAGRITFLPGNRMLLCSKAVFHMIRLPDGSDLWTAPYTKTNFNLNPLAVTPDEAYAYTYDEYRGTRFLTRLFLNTQEHEVDLQELQPDIGATRGILCDEEGTPCLLKTLTETIGGKTVHQNGVRIHDFYDISPGSTTTWKTKWSFDNRISVSFLGSTDEILTNDLSVYQPSTGTLAPLLTPEESSLLPSQPFSGCRTDFTGRYLCLMYQTGNVIVDMQERRIAAQYAADYTQGCLIGGEYWLCIKNQICRNPFPAFEEIPPQKTRPTMDWYVSSRPELW